VCAKKGFTTEYTENTEKNSASLCGLRGESFAFGFGRWSAKIENVTNEAVRLLITQRFCFPYMLKAVRLLKISNLLV
jgi:hypothetical protein